MSSENPTQYCRLSNHSVIAITGKDNKNFLQGQLTCDLEKLNQNHGLYGGYANIQGRLISTFYLCEQETQLLLITPTSNVEPLLTALKKYSVFSKIVFSQTDLQVLSVFGENSKNEFEKRLDITVSDELLSNSIHQDLNILRTISQQESFLIIGTPEKIRTVEEKMSGVTQADHSAWQAFLISQDICELNEHSIEKFLPSEINFSKFKGVSFDKGCFMGQEVIARMHYLGKSKKSLCQVQITSPQIQDIISTSRILDADGKAAGEIAAIAHQGKQNTNANANANALAIMLNTKISDDKATFSIDGISNSSITIDGSRDQVAG